MSVRESLLDPVFEAQGLNTLILNSSRDCIVVLNLQGETLYVSPGGIESMEVADVKAILGLSWLRVWTGHDHELASAAVALATAGGVGRFQGYCATHKGTPKWWDVVISPLPGPDGQPNQLVSIGRDITDLRHVEQRLAVSEQRLKLALEGGAIGVWDWDLESDLVYANEEFARAYGVDPVLAAEGAPIDAYAAGIHKDDIALARELVRDCIKSGNTFAEEYRVFGLDGVLRWIYIRGSIHRDISGRATRFAGMAFDITDRKKAAAELAASQQRLALAVQAADIGTWDFNPDLGELTWDQRTYDLFGVSYEKPTPWDVFMAALHPDDREGVEMACRIAMDPNGDGLYDCEYRVIGLENRIERWISAKGLAFFRNGAVSRFVGTVRDISDLKRAETQQELLTRELEHRMKNTMAMVGAIANQTFRSAATKEDARTIFDARLHALNHAHDILTQSSWTSASMPIVVEGALAAHRSGSHQLRSSGPELELSAKQALSLSLALHELATNATKYGALSVPDGVVDVDWTILPSADGPRLHFEWRERGGPPVSEPARRGFGSRLIENTLSSDFGGPVRIEYSSSGVSCMFETSLTALDSASKILIR